MNTGSFESTLANALRMFDRWPGMSRQDGLLPAFAAARAALAEYDEAKNPKRLSRLTGDAVSHTPTPWRVDDDFDVGGDLRIEGPGRYYIADMWTERLPRESFEQARADAAHIVRCVNSHAALVAALRTVTVGLQSACMVISDDVERKLALEMVADGRAALKLADGSDG